jgi:hypothetical protein
MSVSQPVLHLGQQSKVMTLTVELANARIDCGRRLRKRTENYIVGVHHGPDMSSFTPGYDLFSFCCYRALLLGSPCAIVKAMVRPGCRKLLTEPLPPQRLKGEDTVEPRYWSTRHALQFLLWTRGPSYGAPRFFGYRYSDGVAVASWGRSASASWKDYRPDEVILDSATGAPPTFADLEDFQRKARVLAQGQPLTKDQAWSTWFWLLLHTTFHAVKLPGSPVATKSYYTLEDWTEIRFGCHLLVKAGS